VDSPIAVDANKLIDGQSHQDPTVGVVAFEADLFGEQTHQRRVAFLTLLLEKVG
jgi:hypothetical protein